MIIVYYVYCLLLSLWWFVCLIVINIIVSIMINVISMNAVISVIMMTYYY